MIVRLTITATATEINDGIRDAAGRRSDDTKKPLRSLSTAPTLARVECGRAIPVDVLNGTEPLDALWRAHSAY